MKKILDMLFKPTPKCLPPDNFESLCTQLVELQLRLEELEKENKILRDDLVSCEYRLSDKIDKIHPVVYNITDPQDKT